MNLGKAIRLHRIFSDPSGRLLSVAVDHFAGYEGTMTAGLHNLPKTIAEVAEARPDAVTMLEGTATRCWPPYAGKLALIIQMGCFTPDDRITETLGSIEGIVRIGADAVATAIGVRGNREGYYLRVLSDTVTKAERFGLPVIAHIYPRAYDGDTAVIVSDVANIAWAVRCGIECGADIIKVIYPGDPKAFEEIIDSCPVPVVAAGGPRTETFVQALMQADDIINSGASGLTVGRNVWAPDRNTFVAVTAYKLVVHDRVAPQKAVEMATDMSHGKD
jgi:class I fructose-bisphosphate aldolase